MPEAPEVSQMRNNLKDKILKKSIKNVQFFGRYSINQPKNIEYLLGHLERSEDVIIDDISVHGKFMYWTLSTPCNQQTWYLFITHGMTGGWKTSDSKNPVMKICFSDGFSITMDDARHFATISIVSPYDSPAPQKVLEKKLKTLGPDILHSSKDEIPKMIKMLKKAKNSNICKALMNQSLISGIGNYIKCEALYAASISPHHAVNELDDQTLKLLVHAAKAIAEASYRAKGATLANYSDLEGNKGSAQFSFQCYGRSHDPQGNFVVREKTEDGRTTHWVPSRQF